MTLEFHHVPVLLHETVNAVITNRSGCYLDTTGGSGGHAAELLNQLNDDAKLIIIDRDPQAIEYLRARFQSEPRVKTIWQGRFGESRKPMDELKWEQVDGIIADLGVSSPQLDSPDRGFSLRYLNAPLDLRMGENEQTANEWLSTADVSEVVTALEQGGDFRNADRIAEPLLTAARANRLHSVNDAIEAAFPGKQLPRNVQSRFLQALRIAVNQEYSELIALLQLARNRIRPGGRLAIITFHSGEAKIVKQEFAARDCKSNYRYWKIPVGLKAQASEAEMKHNRRATSAVLRVAERGVDR
ncbi:MAG: 16S rRNA (cytosine(1402)-N(4))-methyltransferase RsmH [bacterium]|nr:16S rRNA (cytosine(1402)-N(4))-methyltransferase RsmH [bacterium]